MLEFGIFLAVELKEFRLAFASGPNGFIKFNEQLEVHHFLREIAAVKTDTEDGFVERLQFLHGEFLGQEFKTDGVEVELFAQALQSDTQDVVVVEFRRLGTSGQQRHRRTPSPPEVLRGRDRQW